MVKKSPTGRYSYRQDEMTTPTRRRVGDFKKCCVDCPCPDATKGGLTLFAGLKLNINHLKVPGCWSSTTKKDAGCADASCAGCCTLAITVEGCVVRRLHNWYGDWLSIWYSE